MKTRPERDPQQTAQCVYSIGETGRPLALRLPQHRHNLKEGLLEKSKLPQHAYEGGGGRVIGWAGMKLGFRELKVTLGIGNTRNRPI
jgi:hypothetical protein